MDAFDKDFINWWINDQPEGGFPDKGEMNPHDDLLSFKQMLNDNGWIILKKTKLQEQPYKNNEQSYKNYRTWRLHKLE